MQLRGVISDEKAFLAHHGVKGMKWGVWNEETRRKYMGSGKEAPRKVPEGAERLGKGVEFKRITNRREFNNLDKSKRLYASMTEEDYAKYQRLAPYLPSILTGNGKAAVLTMKLDKDAYVAPAKLAIEKALGDALGKTVSEYENTMEKTIVDSRFKNETLKNFRESVEDYKTDFGDRTWDEVINKGLFKASTAVEYLQSINLIHFAVSTAVGSYAKKEYQDAYVEKMKDEGFDLVVDPEDWSNWREVGATSPMIILNPGDSMTDFNSEKTTTRKLYKEGTKTLKRLNKSVD